MKIHFIKSATTLIESNGVKILSDPWLVDGEYYGSWFHYPPYDFRPASFDDVDYIYISHIHPDHFSRKTLERLRRDIPVLIHRFDVGFLKRNIELLGFQVIELNHNQRTHLKNGVHINIQAADNCNPEYCMKQFGCGRFESKFGATQIDSLTVIDDGEYRLLNLNDCPYDLAHSCASQIIEQYGSIDFMLLGYAGAGPYPQCFANLSETDKRVAAEKKQNQFLESGRKYLELFKPRYFMPFAGTYTLGGRLSHLNDYRGVPELETAMEFMDVYPESKGVLLNSDGWFDLVDERQSSPFVPNDPQTKKEYVRDVLQPQKLDYELDEFPTTESIEQLIPSAVERMNTIRKSISFSSATKVIIPIATNRNVVISMDHEHFEYMNDQAKEQIEQFVQIRLDSRLLVRILRGPRFGHWNNAEIGSHIEYFRKPDQFERGLFYCMNFFHGAPATNQSPKVLDRPNLKLVSISDSAEH